MAKLRVRAYKPTFGSVSNRQLEAIGEGIRASGDDFEFVDKLSEEADVALVVSGPKKPGSRLWTDRREIHGRFKERLLVSESPFFRRGRQPHDGPNPYFRLSVGGFMRDDGKFHPEGFEADGSRWEMIKKEQGLELQPWQCRVEGPILVCMQKPSDASLRGLDVRKWTQSVIFKIFHTTTRQIVVRPHPLDKSRAGLELDGFTRCCWSKEAALEKDLEKTYAVVTYTSLSAIESVMAGVPTFCLSDANHAWDVSLKDDLLQLFGDLSPYSPERQGWLNALAWGQWKLSELKEGTPWRRLKPLLT